jgi:hypothetical protein
LHKKQKKNREQQEQQEQQELAIKVCHIRPGGGSQQYHQCCKACLLNAPDVIGRACGIPAEMVKLARTLWILLACPYEVDPDKFQALWDRFLELISIQLIILVGISSPPPQLYIK